MPLHAPIGHLKKGSKEKLAKTIFRFLNADASRSKCSFKSEKAGSLNDGGGIQVLCQLKNNNGILSMYLFK